MEKRTAKILALLCSVLIFTACAAQPATSTASSAGPAAPATTDTATSSPMQATMGEAEYLLAHSLPLEGLSAAQWEDFGFGAYDLIFLGEIHANTKTFEAERLLLEYLVEYEGITDLFLELGTCDVYLLNRYLETGDEDMLEAFGQALKETALGNREMLDFYRSLRVLSGSNSTGPLTLYASDIQHSTSTAYAAISLLLPQEAPPQSIEALIRHVQTYPDSPLENDEWLRLVRQNEAACKSYFGDEWDTFCTFVDALEGRWAWHYDHGAKWTYREQYMIDLVTGTLESRPGRRWASIGGGLHSILNAYDWEDPTQPMLGNYLANTYAATAGQVAAVNFQYYKSEVMLPGGGGEPIDAYPLTVEVAPELPGDLTLCRMDLPGSPFLLPEAQLSTAAQQYILTIRYSEATTPY